MAYSITKVDIEDYGISKNYI